MKLGEKHIGSGTTFRQYWLGHEYACICFNSHILLSSSLMHRTQFTRWLSSPVRDISRLSINDAKALTSNQDRIPVIEQLAHIEHPRKAQLIQALIPDFSVYFKLGQQEKAVPEVLKRLIEVNPGRVHLPWELYTQHAPSPSPEVSRAVYAKLTENLEENLGFVMKLLEQQPDLLNSGDSVRELANALEAANLLPFVVVLASKDIVLPAQARKLLSSVKGVTYLALFREIFAVDPTLLTNHDFCDALDALAIGHDLAEFQETCSIINKLTGHEILPMCQTFGDLLIETIVDSGRDVLLDPESLPLRIRLIKWYAVVNDNIDAATALYHKYQRIKYGQALVQTELYKGYCYQAFHHNSELNMQIADTLFPVDDISIRSLQIMIITKANFNTEESLQIYNDYIQQISRKVDPTTSRSSTGLLTESLVLSFLYDHDREFAKLLFDKAVEHKIISCEHEVQQIKRLFKVYSDAFVEKDSWDAARPKLKNFVDNYLRHL